MRLQSLKMKDADTHMGGLDSQIRLFYRVLRVSYEGFLGETQAV